MNLFQAIEAGAWPAIQCRELERQRGGRQGPMDALWVGAFPELFHGLP